jgi:hypothetical protein
MTSFPSFDLERLKSRAATFLSAVGNNLCAGPTQYLATAPLRPDQNIAYIVSNCFQFLNENQKGQVYGKVWELAKMQDPRIGGDDWGRQNAFVDPERLAKAMHRLGFLNKDLDIRHEVKCLSSAFGEGGIGSQYFSLGEKLGRDPATGQLGLVNGMGVPNLDYAGRDASILSDRLLQGYNIHCVYHATHQNTPSGDIYGFVWDVARMKADDGGSYGKTSYLIAQQWIDFLTTHPHAKFLQMASSEGTAHVNAALRLISGSRPDLLARIRVINFCPAYFINPNTYSNGLQVRNLVKREDDVINPWGTGADQINSNQPHVIVVAHQNDDPHNHLSWDFVSAARPYVDEFFRSGNLY